jgi:hypothetical protein
MGLGSVFTPNYRESSGSGCNVTPLQVLESRRGLLDTDLEGSNTGTQQSLQYSYMSHLLPTSCCSQDSIWFEGLESHGIKYERSAWFGQGDRCCCLLP